MADLAISDDANAEASRNDFADCFSRRNLDHAPRCHTMVGQGRLKGFTSDGPLFAEDDCAASEIRGGYLVSCAPFVTGWDKYPDPHRQDRPDVQLRIWRSPCCYADVGAMVHQLLDHMA